MHISVDLRFIGDLLKRVDESVVISDVCDIIYEHSDNHFSVFIDYVRNQQYQEKTYSRLMWDFYPLPTKKYYNFNVKHFENA